MGARHFEPDMHSLNSALTGMPWAAALQLWQDEDLEPDEAGRCWKPVAIEGIGVGTDQLFLGHVWDLDQG